MRYAVCSHSCAVTLCGPCVQSQLQLDASHSKSQCHCPVCLRVLCNYRLGEGEGTAYPLAV